MSVHIGTDRETGRSRGFAFVEFASDDDAARAIEQFNEFELGGRKLRVNPAEDRPRRAPGAPRPFGSRPFGAAPGNSYGGGDGFGGEGFGGGGGGDRPFRKAKGSRRGLRARKRSLG